ncbi:MAG TPA: cell envelope integrity protein CreD [Steroidobacteraceae bacterium]|jgi:inner membrane protein|nr:cell envelope integrity protein CreD [Steroidobacteraceae bacterium]
MSERFRFIPPLLAKALVIGFLIVILLVPLAQMESLVDERVGSREQAAQRVAASWGGIQTTAGVLLTIPVETTRVVTEQTAAGRETQRTEVERTVLYVLPDTLKVDAEAEITSRTVGIYEKPVYTARVQIEGEFVNRDFAQLLPEKQGREVKWGEARLMVLNSESSALRAVDDLVVAGESAQVAADGYAGSAGISTAVPVQALRDSASIPFRMKLTLTGSNRLNFLPLARKADIALKSTWPHPSFEGAPAPLKPVINKDGFSARWSVLEINRNFGQSWYGQEVRPGLPPESAFAQSSVGVAFYEPVDIYQRNYRAVHYAVLLIVITFLTFFLWEHLSGIAIHSMQYLMVGMALALFYLLLLALSEHMSFDLAYGASAGALVTLITVYLTGALKRLALALGAGLGLATLYTMLYWILRSEDYSLLMGSLLLFGVLATLMVATRQIDWSHVARSKRTEEAVR